MSLRWSQSDHRNLGDQKLANVVHVFVSVHGVRRPYTCWCVCRVSWPHFVCASAARVTSTVCV